MLQLIMDSLRYWIVQMHVDGFRFDLASTLARELHDLVSYNEKHNEANGEQDRDGASDNISWNCGVEGPTDDPAIRSLRERKKRSLLATLLFSQGVPMLLSGEAWKASFVRCLGVKLSGGNIDVDEHGETIRGDSILMLFNADHANKIPFTLPQPQEGEPWELLLDTARTNTDASPDIGATYHLEPVSVALFRSKVPKEDGEGKT